MNSSYDVQFAAHIIVCTLQLAVSLKFSTNVDVPIMTVGACAAHAITAVIFYTYRKGE